jgi:hypothetical protein
MVTFGLSEVNLQVIIVVTIRAISLKKVGSGKHSEPKFNQSVGGVSYIDAKTKDSRMPLQHATF